MKINVYIYILFVFMQRIQCSADGWTKHEGIDCSPGKGAASIGALKDMSLADCKTDCKRRLLCEGIVIKTDDQENTGKCYLRKNITIGKCQSDQIYTTHLVSGKCKGKDSGCCTNESPCAQNDGDCDHDSQCSGNLVCGKNNCEWGKNDDCCKDGGVGGAVGNVKSIQGATTPAVTEAAGTIKYLTSPNYPNNYPNNQHISQTLSVPEGASIKVTFHDFQIENHDSCHYDYVQFCPRKRACLNKICGTSPPQEFKEFKIETSTATVKFHSDGSTTLKGFKLSYQGDQIDGEWTEWDQCSKTCAVGLKRRTCTNPVPQNGGANCSGEHLSECNVDIQCVMVSGALGDGRMFVRDTRKFVGGVAAIMDSSKCCEKCQTRGKWNDTTMIGFYKVHNACECLKSVQGKQPTTTEKVDHFIEVCVGCYLKGNCANNLQNYKQRTYDDYGCQYRHACSNKTACMERAEHMHISCENTFEQKFESIFVDTPGVETVYSFPKKGDHPCGIDNPSARISGGTITSPNQYPWMVRLPRGCGGSLISDRHILTAKHCVYGKNLHNVYVRVHNIYDRNDYEKVPVNRSFIPQTIRRSDIAVILLDRPVDLSDKNIGTVCLPSDANKDYRGKRAMAMGWGWIPVTGGQSKFLQHLELTVAQRQAKNWLYTKTRIINGVPLDVCRGDSGGPLVYYEHGHWTVIGTVASGDACDHHRGRDGKWNKVTDHLSWIKNVLKILV